MVILFILIAFFVFIIFYELKNIKQHDLISLTLNLIILIILYQKLLLFYHQKYVKDKML